MSIPTFLSVAFEDSLHLDMELIKKKGYCFSVIYLSIHYLKL